jgi:hypothetical protein
MTIRYANGHTKDAVLLSRTEHSMRVALEGADDLIELRQINGTWISDCEPVQVTFAWRRNARPQELKEADCICSHELAARLISMLCVGGDRPETNRLHHAARVSRRPELTCRSSANVTLQ